jgi:hypothetical protein
MCTYLKNLKIYFGPYRYVKSDILRPFGFIRKNKSDRLKIITLRTMLT